MVRYPITAPQSQARAFSRRVFSRPWAQKNSAYGVADFRRAARPNRAAVPCRKDLSRAPQGEATFRRGVEPSACSRLHCFAAPPGMEEALAFLSLAAVHSRQWRRHRGRAALLARPQTTLQGQPLPPAQSTWACPRKGRVIRQVRHWRDPAYRREHRNRAVTGHRCPRYSCRGSSISGQPRRLQSTPRSPSVGHRPR